MNILLIIPPNIPFRDFVAPPPNVKVSQRGDGVAYGSVITDMPLGIIALAAYVRKNVGCQVVAVDFNVELNKVDGFNFSSFGEFFRHRLVAKDGSVVPDVIGISALFSTAYWNLVELGKVCRDIYPLSFIVAGGNVPTVSYKDIFRDTDAFDAVCYGEGELSLSRLLRASDLRVHVERDPGWITRQKLTQQDSFEHSFIEDLDLVPFDYSVIDESDYQLNPTVNYYTGICDKGKSFNIMTSRGCPFKCIFCASHRTHGREMRYESLERVKSNIQSLRDEHGVKVITFEDDHFMGDKQRAYEIVRFVGQLGLTAFFPNSLALYALDRRMLEALKAADVQQLILAVESGSDRVLKRVMKKPLKLDIVRRVAADCRDLGIYTDCNILIGLPGETKEDISDTRRFLKTVGANWFRINVATPLLGSEMHEICEDKNYFKGIVVESNYKKAIVETEDFSAAFIQQATYDMNIELNFVFNADMRLGDFKTALRGFENALKSKPDHALALYYAAQCHEAIGEAAKSREYLLHVEQAIAATSFWDQYIETYRIPVGAGRSVASETP